MKAFEWANPKSVEEAVALLRSTGTDPDEAPMPLAGGQDLLTNAQDEILRPARVVNLKNIPGLAGITGDAGKGFRIGALVTIADLASHAAVRAAHPGLAEAAAAVATPQIRNLGTVGGNLCQRPRCWYYRLPHVSCLKKGGHTCYAAEGENKYNAIFGGGPSYIVHPSDLAPMLVALEAQVTIAGGPGKRTLPIDRFFIGPTDGDIRRENVLASGEIVTEVTVPPARKERRSTYLKFRERASLDFALSAVAAVVDRDGAGTVSRARLVLGGVAPVPWRVAKAETLLVGSRLGADVIARAAEAALEGAEPLSQNAYKVPLTRTLVRRALSSLAGGSGQ